jgi:hypothetical protein
MALPVMAVSITAASDDRIMSCSWKVILAYQLLARISLSIKRAHNNVEKLLH